MPGAPSVVVLGYDVWQRSLGSRQDVLGSVVKLGNTPAIVIGVMPKGFGYPVNHDAWTPLSLRASYEALEGGAISVIGRLVPGVTREQANAELRVLGERTAAAFPATHEHLRPRVVRTLGGRVGFHGHPAVRVAEPAGAAGADHCVHERRHAGLRENGDTRGGNGRAFRARCGPRAHHRSALRGGPRARLRRGCGRSHCRRPGVGVGDRKREPGQRRRTVLDDPRPEAVDDSVCLRSRGRQRGDVVTAACAESHGSARAIAPREPGRRLAPRCASGASGRAR